MNPVVEAFQQFRMDGNIIPHSWYQSPQLCHKSDQKSGKPNLVAITLLADIIYWYRPAEIRDETSGTHLGYRQKFGADKLQKSYRKWGDGFGFTLRQVEDAMAFLKAAGLITVERRTVMTEMGTFPNCAFIEPVFVKVRDLTYPPDEKAAVANGKVAAAKRSPVKTGDVPRSSGRRSPVPAPCPSRSSAGHGTPEGEHTKTPSENSKKTLSGEAAGAAPEGSASLFEERSPEPEEVPAPPSWSSLSETAQRPYIEQARSELQAACEGVTLNPLIVEARGRNLYHLAHRW